MLLDTTLLLHWAKIACLVIGSLLGFVAACVWFKASTARLMKDESQYDVGIELGGTDSKGQPIQVVATAMKQSELNKVAAIITAFAVLFQALAGILSLWL